MKSRSMMMLALLGLGLMGTPLFAADQGDQATQPRQAIPGVVNYVQGAVYLNGSKLNPSDVANATVQPGQELATDKGKAEMLLTPGVFLRLDDNSAAKMISPDLAMTQVELDKGRAGIEVDEIHDQNDLQVIDGGVTTRLNKRGYYEFNANQPEVMVFKGEAHVQVNDNQWKKIKGDHEFALNEGPELAKEKPQKFNKKDAKGELYAWNSLRSEYMAEANNQMASAYTGPYAGPGWYWDPWAYDYAYMGFGPFASPFGFGFYPFGWGGFYPYGGGFYGSYYGHPHVFRYDGDHDRDDVGHMHHGIVGGALHGRPGGVRAREFGGLHNGRSFEGGFHNGGGFSGFHGGGVAHGGHH